ncbi:MAG: recombination mediator RecR [Chryseolinea sp.]
MEYPSRLIENAVNEIAKLPGIGKKTALRLALHLIRDKEENTTSLTDALNTLRSRIKFCSTCHNISDDDVCSICISHRRDRAILCVVEDAKDVMAIENTAQYNGVYHVLGGVISPMNGVGPTDIRIETLVSRLNATPCEIREVILALSPTMEGDTTSFYINRRLKDLTLKVTVIARGVPVGGDLEYADEITLGRSILGRTLFS